MKRGFWYIGALLILLCLGACSTKKNTKASRFYHAFTTRYNIYFNGKEAFNEALKSQLDGHKDNYADMIYMYPISALPKEKSETGGPFDRTIEKSTSCIPSRRSPPRNRVGGTIPSSALSRSGRNTILS